MSFYAATLNIMEEDCDLKPCCVCSLCVRQYCSSKAPRNGVTRHDTFCPFFSHGSLPCTLDEYIIEAAGNKGHLLELGESERAREKEGVQKMQLWLINGLI